MYTAQGGLVYKKMSIISIEIYTTEVDDMRVQMQMIPSLFW